jgi:hypothetical protein
MWESMMCVPWSVCPATWIWFRKLDRNRRHPERNRAGEEILVFGEPEVAGVSAVIGLEDEPRVIRERSAWND